MLTAADQQPPRENLQAGLPEANQDETTTSVPYTSCRLPVSETVLFCPGLAQFAGNCQTG